VGSNPTLSARGLEMSVSPNLADRSIDDAGTVRAAMDDADLLSALLDGIAAAPRGAILRENCGRVLLLLARQHPQRLYPHWDYFASLLRSSNAFSKMAALHIVADLTKVDSDLRFDGLLDEYFSLLGDTSVAVAAHVAGTAGAIAAARPALTHRIIEALLGIDNTALRADRRDLVKGYAVESFGDIHPNADAADQARILEFVQGLTRSESTKTRKQAKAFLAHR
jgi:hypothetical protein